MSTSHLFCFAAKSLQNYIMRGGKLRDMVGATSLIDKLATKKELEKWLTESFGISKEKFEILQAAAGSGRIRFSDEADAKAVERVWPLWCHAWAPDLEVVQSLKPWDASYGKVSEAAGEELERNRNFPAPRMPEAGPFAKLAPRTGEPVVTVDDNADNELIDHASQRKRAERQALKRGELPPVADSFGFTDPQQLPDDFEQVSGGKGAYLAVIHADGNRLRQMFLKVGQALEKLPADQDRAALSLFRYLSEVVVARGTQAAARIAIEAVKPQIDSTVAANKEEAKKHPEAFRDKNTEAWAFAPIVLAGDDVTVVCRADLGLPFTTAFLKAFRSELKKRLDWLRKNEFPTGDERPPRCKDYEGLWSKVANHPDVVSAVPSELTAGAGVVFCTDHYPFSLAYELCESLAKQAKGTAKKAAEKAGKPTPDSAISFVRITGASAPTEFKDLAEGILKGADGALLTGCPYFVDGDEAPQFDALWAVYKTARPQPDCQDPRAKRKLGLPGSALRNLLNLQRTKTDAIKDTLRDSVERMEEVAIARTQPDSARRKSWDRFEKRWNELCRAKRENWQMLRFGDHVEKFTRSDGKQYDRSPLYDLLTLLVIRDKTDDDTLTDEGADHSPIPAK
jgi:hypothetical protein